MLRRRWMKSEARAIRRIRPAEPRIASRARPVNAIYVRFQLPAPEIGHLHLTISQSHQQRPHRSTAARRGWCAPRRQLSSGAERTSADRPHTRDVSEPEGYLPRSPEAVEPLPLGSGPLRQSAMARDQRLTLRVAQQTGAGQFLVGFRGLRLLPLDRTARHAMERAEWIGIAEEISPDGEFRPGRGRSALVTCGWGWLLWLMQGRRKRKKD